MDRDRLAPLNASARSLSRLNDREPLARPSVLVSGIEAQASERGRTSARGVEARCSSAELRRRISGRERWAVLPPTPCYSGFCRRPHRHLPAWRTSSQAPRLNGSERRITPARSGEECGWRGSNPHGSGPPVSETGASTGSATSARGAAGRGAGGGSSVTRPGVGTRGRVAPPRGAPCGGSRGRRPWPGAADPAGSRRPVRGASACVSFRCVIACEADGPARTGLSRAGNPVLYRLSYIRLRTRRCCQWRRRESNPLLLGASEAFFQKNLIPWWPASAGGSAGGIRTHGLELMRLARTAAPLPRVVRSARARQTKSWPAGVEPAFRFPRPEWPCSPTASCCCDVAPGRRPNVLFHATRLPFDPGSTRPGCAFRPVAVLRGGALEPEPRALLSKRAG